MNEVREKESYQEWIDSEHSTMSIEDLVRIAIQGFGSCPEDDVCLSRSLSGVNACRCVRSVFPSDDHYQLYEQIRALILAIELLSEMKESEIYE